MAIFQSPKNIFQRLKFPGKSPEIPQKERFSPNFKVRNFKIQSPTKCNSTPPAIPYPSLDSLLTMSNLLVSWQQCRNMAPGRGFLQAFVLDMLSRRGLSFVEELRRRRPQKLGALEAVSRKSSETGRTRFRRVRFQTPNSVKLLALTELRGENSVSSSQPGICVPKRTHRVFCRKIQ